MILIFLFITSFMLSYVMVWATYSDLDSVSDFMKKCSFMFNVNVMHRETNMAMPSCVVLVVTAHISFIWLAVAYWVYKLIKKEG